MASPGWNQVCKRGGDDTAREQVSPYPDCLSQDLKP
jgi:hypothetical protein